MIKETRSNIQSVKNTYYGSLFLVFILFLVLIIKTLNSQTSADQLRNLNYTTPDKIIKNTSSNKVDKASENEGSMNKQHEKNIINDLTVKENIININTASVSQLMKLKGIGKVTAERIVKYREINGSFKSVNELVKVKGIGSKKLDMVKDNLILNKTE